MNPPVVIHDAAQNRWLAFDNPVNVITTGNPGDITGALQALEEEVNQKNHFAAGFLSYEAAPAFDNALIIRPDRSGFPLLWFGLYPPPREFSNLSDIPQFAVPEHPDITWTPSISRIDYDQAVDRIRHYLLTGDTYQVNYTFRLNGRCPASPQALFRDMVQAQGPHYSAFVDTGDYVLCSASPELFFRLDGNRLESHPMKGTEKRGLTFEDDLKQAERLAHSEKNRAENVMIVDMIRNDIGRVAKPGTITPEPLFEVKRYPTVWQMISTVRAQTQASVTDIMAALFPCASITGAPKPRTMEIIAETETTPRRIYTGTIGYIAPGRRAQFNVAIRTVLLDTRKGLAEYGVGGGIVWDSETDSEYGECWLKAQVLTEKQPAFELLETLLWTPDAGYFLLDRHLARARDSADYFAIPLKVADVVSALHDHVSQFASDGSYRVRLLIAGDGTIQVQSVPFCSAEIASPARVKLAREPIDPSNRFLYHKTTRRQVYEQAKSAFTDCDDVLLWNPRGELTESTIANIVVERDGKLLTPPVTCGLLPGTFRAELLAQGTIEEAVIRVEEIPLCSKLYLVNSVRKWRPVLEFPHGDA